MRFEGQLFSGEVTLDHNEFIDCEFRDCRVVFHGGTFSIVRVKFTRVQFELRDQANNTLAFLRLVRSQGEELITQLLDAGQGPVAIEAGRVN